jgi:ribosomal protein S27E
MSIIEKSADESDMASDMEEAFREKAIEYAQSHIRQHHPDFDGVNCLDCEEPMIAFRLTMGRIRCVYCQEIVERREKGLHADN